MKNCFEHIDFQMATRPERTAIVMEDRVVTYGMLNAGIERCVRRIRAQAIDRPGAVAVMVKNPIRHLALCFALFRLGIVSLSLEHTQSGIQSMTFAAVIGDAGAAPRLAAGNKLIEATDEWFATDLPASQEPTAGFTDVSEVCRLSLTSGSTGIPKIVEHSIEDLGRRIIRHIDSNWQRILCLPGLSTNWGFSTSCAALATGRTLCFAESPFQAIRMIELFAIDFVMASTEQLLALTRVARASGTDFPSLRTIWFGGTVPTRVLLESAMIYLCNNILCRYAAAEIGLIAEAPAREVLARPGLIGRVAPGIRVEVRDSTDKACPPGKVGTIRVAIAPDGGERDGRRVVELGDVGWLDQDNRLYGVRRSSDGDAASSGATDVDEIEHMVRLEWDFVDAAAVLIDGADRNARQTIGFAIVGNHQLTDEMIANVVRSRGYDYAFKIVQVNAIPRGANGKVNRQQLKAMVSTGT